MAMKEGTRLDVTYNGDSATELYDWKLQGCEEPQEGNDKEGLEEILQNHGSDVKFCSINYSIINEDADAIKLLFQTIPEHCPNVEDVSILSGSPDLPADYSKIAEYWQNLVVLNINPSGGAKESDLKSLLENNKKLECFSINIQKETHLETYDFFNYLPADEIQEINITTWDGKLPSDSFIAASKNFTRLRSLSFNNCKMFDDEIINAIGNLVNLKQLQLPSCRVLNDDKLAVILTNCTQLELLNIKRCDEITNAGLRQLIGLKNLKVLSIDRIGKISDEFICDLPESLECLICGFAQITNNGAIDLVNILPNLRLLDLYHCEAITIEILDDVQEIMAERPDFTLWLRFGRSSTGSDQWNTDNLKLYYSPKSDLPDDLLELSSLW